MKLIANKLIIAINNKINNPMQSISHSFESPEDSAFAISKPMENPIKISDGRNKPIGVKFNDNSHGIAKSDPVSTLTEPLAYHLSKLTGAPIPKTVNRNINGKLHSIQERVPGLTHQQMDGLNNKEKVYSHPDYVKMSYNDWLTGQNDRHEGNYIVDKKNNKVHSIDNGDILQHKQNSYELNNKNNVINSFKEGHTQFNLSQIPENTPIPDDFRHNVINTPVHNHERVLNSFLQNEPLSKAINHVNKNYPTYPWHKGKNPEQARNDIITHYKNHYNTLQQHLNDPTVKTTGDLYDRLYPKK